jgi:hypothetical protein
MFLCKSMTPRELDALEDELAVAACEARLKYPSHAVYTDGLFWAPTLTILMPEEGREYIEAVLPDGWQPCDDAAEFEWFMWAGPTYRHERRHGLPEAKLGGKHKAYSRPAANDDMALLPLFDEPTSDNALGA